MQCCLLPLARACIRQLGFLCSMQNPRWEHRCTEACGKAQSFTYCWRLLVLAGAQAAQWWGAYCGIVSRQKTLLHWQCRLDPSFLLCWNMPFIHVCLGAYQMISLSSAGLRFKNSISLPKLEIQALLSCCCSQLTPLMSLLPKGEVLGSRSACLCGLSLGTGTKPGCILPPKQGWFPDPPHPRACRCYSCRL